MRRLAAVLLAVGALLGASAAPARPASPSFHLLFADGFNTPTMLGSFSGCDHNDDTRQAYCSGLAGSVRAAYWAYPQGWPDTATQRGYPVGGYYDPATTVWIAPSRWGDGQLHIRMWRGPSGPVHSATIVPKAAMGLTYGKYEERWRVSHAAPGYKSAHLLWPNNNADCCEEDFAEGEWDTTINGYNHNLAGDNLTATDTGASWSSWHTTDILWKPGLVQYFLDGRLVDQTTRDVPSTPMNWDIQNESALNGESAAPNSWAQMDVTYVKVWSYS